MKKIWGLILIIMSSLVIVQAKELNLENEILNISYIDGYYMQGFTVAKDSLFIVFIKRDESASIIKVYNLNNYELVDSYEFNDIGHANDVTYNSKENIIYVLGGGGENIVYRFDGDTYDYLNTVDAQLPLRSVTYIASEDLYAGRTVTAGYFLDSNWQMVGTMPFVMGMNFKSSIARQGWAYYDGNIYYTNWSWVRYGGDGKSFIYVYDLKGKRKGYFLIKQDVGEIEDVAFFKDKMLLGFNGNDGDALFYLEDIPELDDEELEENIVEIKENNEDIINYNLFFIIIIIVLVILIGFIIRKKKDASK